MAKAKKSEDQPAAKLPGKPTSAKQPPPSPAPIPPKAAHAAVPAPQARPAATSAAPKSPAPKPVAKKGKQNKPATQPATRPPLVDTSFAAESAARMLAARAKLHPTEPSTEPEEDEKESDSFKQLKQSVNKPGAQGLNKAMGSTFGTPKSNLPTQTRTGAQVFQNQTQGGENRFNVPRRTGG